MDARSGFQPFDQCHALCSDRFRLPDCFGPPARIGWLMVDDPAELLARRSFENLLPELIMRLRFNGADERNPQPPGFQDDL
jgi:hypothetical protein